MITTIDEAFHAYAEAIIAPFGWQILFANSVEAATAMLTQWEPAVLLVDGEWEDAANVIATVRQQAQPLNGTPILLAGAADLHLAGAGGHVESSIDHTALVELLRRWAGPLGDHAARAHPWSFRYRLIRLLGLDAADGMLARLRGQLDQALLANAAEPPPAHRLAGICGMCGFPELSAQWNAADRGEDGALSAALAASREAIAQIDRALSVS